jgi:hypothetical protein
MARPDAGEDPGVLSESLLKDIEALAPQIEEILGPVPFAEAAE